jgi:DNA-directed RNA polymerase subunit RPC12/RpoP
VATTIYKSGETPGEGVYRCTACGRRVTLHDDDEPLPLCVQCRANTWMKVK